MPRIRHTLEDFCDGWNNHGIRTEHNKSPIQLFTAGSLELQHSGLAGLDFFEDVDDLYGIDEQGMMMMKESVFLSALLSLRIVI